MKSNDLSHLAEPIVDALARMESATSGELSDLSGASPLRVRGVLLELERLGIVYRTGRARSTRWWLG